MKGIERIQYALSHKEADRIPKYDCLWPKTVERWENEGLEKDIYINEYFDFDMNRVAVYYGAQLEEKIFYENDEFIIKKNADGEIIKNLDRMAEFEFGQCLQRSFFIQSVGDAGIKFPEGHVVILLRQMSGHG